MNDSVTHKRYLQTPGKLVPVGGHFPTGWRWLAGLWIISSKSNSESHIGESFARDEDVLDESFFFEVTWSSAGGLDGDQGSMVVVCVLRSKCLP